MTEKAITKKESQGDIVERVVIMGDLSPLQPAERVQYYKSVCESVGLNPLTKPFDYINLNGKLTLYAKKDATDQLRQLRGVSITALESKTINEVYMVTASARDGQGRVDVATGAVSIKGLSGDAMANALMKTETKAKRRVTLSICGLGWLDETELETIPTAAPVVISDMGEIVEELPFEPDPDEPAKMSLETAQNVTSSTGQRYGDLSREKLSGMAGALRRKLAERKDASEDERNEWQFKLDAIKVLMAAAK